MHALPGIPEKDFDDTETSENLKMHVHLFLTKLFKPLMKNSFV